MTRQARRNDTADAIDRPIELLAVEEEPVGRVRTARNRRRLPVGRVIVIRGRSVVNPV